MKKTKFNALIAAGCIAFLAPSSAQAEVAVWGDITTTENAEKAAPADGATYTTITTSGNYELTIDAGAGAVNPTADANAGTVTMSGSSAIILNPNVKGVTFNSTKITGTNKITQEAGGTGVTIGTARLGAVTVENSGNELEVISKGGSITAGTTVLKNGANATFTADGGTITVDNVELNGANTLTLSQGVTLSSGINVVGTGNKVSGDSQNLGGVSFNASTAASDLTIDGKSTIMGTVTAQADASDATLNINKNGGSATSFVTTAPSAPDKTTKLTVKQTVGTTTFNTATVGAGTTLTLNADGAQTKLTGNGTGSSAVVLGDNSTLAIKGSGTVTTNGLSLTNVNATVDIDSASQANARLGNVSLSGSTLKLKGVSNDNIGTITLTGNNTFNLNGSAINDASVGAGGGLSLVAEGNTQSTFGNVSLAAGTDADNATALRFSTAEGSLQGGGLSLAGNSLVTITNSESTPNTNAVSLTGGLSVAGTNNAIDNNGSAAFSVTGDTTFTDGGTSSLTVDGAYTLGAIKSGGTDTITFNGTGTTGAITVSSGDTLTVNGSTTYTTGTVTGGTLNLSAADGTTITSSGVNTLAGGTIYVSGAGKTTLNGVSASGANNVITNAGTATAAANANTFGPVTVGASAGLTINSNSAAGTSLSAIDMNAGTNTAKTTLTLNANTGAINATTATLKGNTTLNITGAQNTTLTGVATSGTGNVIDNTSTSATANTLGGLTMGASSALVLNSNAAAGTGLSAIVMNAGTSADAKTNLTLNANTGDINVSSIAMAGENNLTLTGTKAVKVAGKTTITGSGNVLSNTAGTGTMLGAIELTSAVAEIAGVEEENRTSFTFVGDNTVYANNVDFGDISVESAKDLTIEAKGATTIGDITLAAGVNPDSDATPAVVADNTNLTLSATDAAISADALYVNGANAVSLSGDNAITFTGVYVKAGQVVDNVPDPTDPTQTVATTIINNTITSTSTAVDVDGNGVPVSLGSIAFYNGEDTTPATAATNALKLTGAFNATDVASGGNDTLDIEGAATLGNITVNQNDTLYLNVSDSDTTDNILTSISASSLDMKGGTTFNITGEQGTVAISSVKASGTSSNVVNNYINGTTLGAVDLATNPGSLVINSVVTPATGTTATTRITTSSLNGSTLSVNAGSGNAFTASGLTTLNGNSTLNLSGQGIVALSGITASGTNNVVNSGNLGATILGALTVSDAASALNISATQGTAGYSTSVIDNGSTLTLNANGGTITGTDLNTIRNGSTLSLAGGSTISLHSVKVEGNGTITNNNALASVGGIDLSTAESNLTINATKDFGYLAATLDDSKLTVNATGNVTSTGTTTISNGSTFATSGAGAIDLTATKVVGTGNTLDIKNANTSLGNTILGDVGATSATRFTTVNANIDTINVDSLTSNAATVEAIDPATGATVSTTQNPQWTLDIDVSGAGSADKLVLTTTASGKLDISVGSVLNQPTDSTEKYVKYITLVEPDSANATTSYVLNTTSSDQRNIKQKDSVLYSYVDNEGNTPDASRNYYKANTIRVTNYLINSDELLDHLTRQGIREYDIATDSTQYLAKTGITALPNMEALAGVNNSLTVSGLGILDGRQREADDIDSTTRTQMFTVDTTGDSIERTLNLQGFTYQNALSAPDASRPYNTGNGAVLHTVSSNTAATVNISSFTETAADNTTTTKQPVFTSNTATGDGGVIYNDGAFSIVNFVADTEAEFNSNVAYGNGGAIANVNGATLNFADTSATIFDSNVAAGLDNTRAVIGNGGAVYATGGTVNFDGAQFFNTNAAAGDGGAVYNNGATVNLNGTNLYVGNYAAGNGGAIAAGDGTTNLTGTQLFTANQSSGKGGAIYAKGTNRTAIVNLTASNPDIDTVFAGNFDSVVVDAAGDVTSSNNNAIYLDGNAQVNLATENGAKIVFNDAIAGTANAYNVITQSGNVYYNNNNSAYAGDFVLNSGANAYFTNAASKAFEGGNYTLAGGSTLHLNNGVVDKISANSLDLTGTTVDNAANLVIDMNLSQEAADRFELANSTTGEILVTGINSTGYLSKKQAFFEIAEGANVNSTVKEIETPYYMYDVLGHSATGRQDGLLLKKGRLTDTALLAPQVAANARLAGQLAMYDQLLHRVDEIAESRYFNKVNRTNLYASAHDVIDNSYTPYVHQEDGGSAWMKPSVTLETIRPDGIGKYKNRAYNTILGYETPVSTLGNGWELINTVFGGYQGSFQKYDNVENHQNGGVGGYMANLYKNNFFASGVVMAGGAHVDVKDTGKYGRGMSYGMYDIGGAARVGYNVGLGEHWLFQPMFTTSYTFISGVDEHNKRGERMDMKGTNTIQISPGFKLVGNYSGWQPYLLFDYTWPLIAKTVANVNNIGLPDAELRSYVEYGAGFRKNVGDRFTGYAEAVMRNGGRTGVSLQGGLVFKF